MMHLPLDAIPDLSETQVIILSRWDRSPDIIEDQVTYPILSAMTGAPHVKTVRGISDFGFSYVYVIFEEGTDIYWARSRTLEYLSSVTSRLPPDVRTEIGPDATSLRLGFSNMFLRRISQHNLGELRSYQDWYLKYYLKQCPAWLRWLPWVDLRSSIRSTLTPTVCAPTEYDFPRGRRGPGREPRVRRETAGIWRRRIHDSRPGILALAPGH